MHVDTAVLSAPVAQGVRLVALGFLDDVHAAAEQLARAHDADALHDFRVAVRRLRSWVRAFDEEFDGTVKKKDRRRLRELAHATNAGRDVDVQIVWLKDAAKGFRWKRRRGADWLADYLKARQRRSGDPVDTALIAQFERARAALVERLSTYEAHVELPQKARTLGAAIADRVMPHAEELGEKLAAVHAADDETEAHEARIAAKRLRYLIEPAVESVDKGDEILRALKSLQDGLGTLHDAHVMGHQLRHALEIAAATEAPSAPSAPAGSDSTLVLASPRDGLRALARRARADARDAFGRVQEEWLGDRFARFSADLAVFADRLSALHA